MKLPCDERFASESARYRLRFVCEDCVHFVPWLAQCEHEYPTSAHLRATYEVTPPPAEVVFCKEFELA